MKAKGHRVAWRGRIELEGGREWKGRGGEKGAKEWGAAGRGHYGNGHVYCKHWAPPTIKSARNDITSIQFTPCTVVNIW